MHFKDLLAVHNINLKYIKIVYCEFWATTALNAWNILHLHIVYFKIKIIVFSIVKKSFFCTKKSNFKKSIKTIYFIVSLYRP